VGFRGEAVLGDSVRAFAAPGPAGGFLHRLEREGDGRELTRLRTRWVPRGTKGSSPLSG